MLKPELLHAIQQEIRQHDFSNFVDEPPSVAQARKAIVTLTPYPPVGVTRPPPSIPTRS